MVDKTNLDGDLKVRVNEEELERFKKKSPVPYQLMIREMITAFNEDRIKIIPTEAQKDGLKIYQGEV